jgi:hypothetical protein
MSPAEIEALAPLIVFLVIAFVVSIPVVAFSLRFAARPVVDALVRLREVQGKTTASDETMLLHDRRMSLLESELQHVHTTLERLVDAERFHAQLDAPAPAAAPALPAARRSAAEHPA